MNYFLIRLRFLNEVSGSGEKKYKISNKGYEFLYKSERGLVTEYYIMSGKEPIVKIETTTGYTYRGSWVAIEYIKGIAASEYNRLIREGKKEIASITCSSEINHSQLILDQAIEPWNPTVDYADGSNGYIVSTVKDKDEDKARKDSYDALPYVSNAVNNLKLNTSSTYTINNNTIPYSPISNTINDYCCCASTSTSLQLILDQMIKEENQVFNRALDSAVNRYMNRNSNSDKNKKGDIKMKNFNDLFKFGTGYTNSIKMSMYGPAFWNGADDTYLAYDKTTNQWINVDNFIFNIHNAFYAMPVAKKDVKVGDFILHRGGWVRVCAISDPLTINENAVATLRVENPFDATIYEILPEKSIFGFDFYTKLVSLFDGVNANADNPFGNPMLMMMLMDEKGSDSKFSDLLPFMLMQGNTTNLFGGEVTSNPLFLMMLMDKNN